MKKTSLLLLLIAFSVSAISQSYMAMVKPAGSKEWGYISDKGEMVIPANYRKCYPFSPSGMAAIYQSKKFHFITTSGEQLQPEIGVFDLHESWGRLNGFSDGLVAVKNGALWGFMNTKGEIAIPQKYEKITPFNGGFAIVNIGAKYMVINTKGEETIIKASDIIKVKAFSEGLAIYTTVDKKVGFINTKGELAIPAKFLSVGDFSSGVAWAKGADAKVGYIDAQGEWVITPQFLATKNFGLESEMARVKTATGWSYVDKKGVPMVVTDTEVWGDFYNGLAKGRKLGAFGFYDKTGKWIIKPQFEGVRDFKNGFAAAKLNGLWGFVNTQGEWVVEAKYAAVKDMEVVN